MIDPAYVQRMARYNRWQNANLYGVADQLSDDERRREHGAFFALHADAGRRQAAYDRPAGHAGVTQ